MNIGDQFPDFTLPRDGGETMSLNDFAGSKLVIFLYPKDNTSGCTKESIEFTAKSDEFEVLNTKIVGLSKDSAASMTNSSKNMIWVCPYCPTKKVN